MIQVAQQPSSRGCEWDEKQTQEGTKMQLASAISATSGMKTEFVPVSHISRLDVKDVATQEHFDKLRAVDQRPIARKAVELLEGRRINVYA